MFKVKVYKNSSFSDKRGYYWTSWKKGLIKNLEFKHDKFSLSKKISFDIKGLLDLNSFDKKEIFSFSDHFSKSPRP